MRKLEITRDAHKFVSDLDAKPFRQVVRKMFSLLTDPQGERYNNGSPSGKRAYLRGPEEPTRFFYSCRRGNGRFCVFLNTKAMKSKFSGMMLRRDNVRPTVHTFAVYR